METAKAVGIDLRTTNSVVAVIEAHLPQLSEFSDVFSRDWADFGRKSALHFRAV